MYFVVVFGVEMGEDCPVNGLVVGKGVVGCDELFESEEEVDLVVLDVGP